MNRRIRYMEHFGFTPGSSIAAQQDHIARIGSYALLNCGSLKVAYYGGSERQWKEMSIDNGNTPLLNARIHFNSTGPVFSDVTGERRNWSKIRPVAQISPFVSFVPLVNLAGVATPDPPLTGAERR